jgi:methionyl-tRNA formyltransferase
MRRVLLIGQGPTTGSALDSLLLRFEVAGLVRGGRDAVASAAREHGVPVLPDTSAAAVEAAVRELRPDCVVVSSYDRILPASLLERSRFVNVHYAQLPEYRGRATVNWAILDRRPETALTIHVLVAELDAGPILFQQRVPIGPHDTVGELYTRLNDLQRAHLASVVDRHLDGDAGIPQDEPAATYGCTRVPQDGEIDWDRPTEEVYALVRALGDPYPGAFTHLDGRRLVVWRAAPAASPRRWAGRVPGRVVGRSGAEGWVDVLTADGVLRVEVVEPQGDARQPAAAVVLSVRATLGLRPVDLLERLHALEAALSAQQQHQDDRLKAVR